MSTSTYLTTLTNWAGITPAILPSVADILAQPSINFDDAEQPDAQYKVKSVTDIAVVEEVQEITGQTNCYYQVWLPGMNGALMRTGWGITRDHVFEYILQTGGSSVTVSFYQQPAGWDNTIYTATPEQQSQFTLLYTETLQPNQWYNIQEKQWFKFEGLTQPQVSLWFADPTLNQPYYTDLAT